MIRAISASRPSIPSFPSTNERLGGVSPMSQLQVESVAVDGQQHHGESLFPYVLLCQDPECLACQSAAQWVETRRSGTIGPWRPNMVLCLLRGFPVTRAEDFDVLIESLGSAEFSVRKVSLQRGANQSDAACLLGQRSAAGCADFLSSRDGANATVPSLDFLQL